MSDPRADLERLIGPIPRGGAEIRAEEDRWQVPTYAKPDLVLVEGRGCYVTDVEGRTYLDLYGGHAVALLGHSHPRLVEALRLQASRLLFYSNLVYNDVRAAAVARVAALAPEGLRKVFLCNSGSEANETALKIARKHTGRRRVVAMREGFHGRTLGSLSATGLEAYRDPAYPLAPDHDFVPYGDVAAAQGAVRDDVAAVLLEPIPSMGGIRVADGAYFQGLRALCDRTGALLIFDEVQTGFGRTGRAFFGEHVGVTPDLITGAKGMAGGFPAGCVLVREDLAARIRPGEQGTTFGGGPLASAAIAAVAQAIVEEDLAARAERVGAILQLSLETLGGVERVDGLGLMLGVTLDRDAKPVIQGLRESGILVGGSSLPRQIRLLPPLVLTEDEAATVAPTLAAVLATGVRPRGPAGG